MTVRLDEVPKTVVAQSIAAASLLDAGYQVAGVYGELGTKDGKLDYQAGSLDLSKVTVLGKTYGDVSIERYAALQPDLLVDQSMDSKTLWYIPPEASKQIYALAPAVGMKMLGLALPPIIEQFVDLAQMLGADPEAPALRTAKADFDDAVAEGRAAVAAKPRPQAPREARCRLRRREDQTRHVLPADQLGTGRRLPGGRDRLRRPRDPQDRRGGPVDRYLDGVARGQGRTGLYPWHPAAPYSYRTYAPLYRDVARWLKSSRPLAT